jgi:hypothetical protein
MRPVRLLALVGTACGALLLAGGASLAAPASPTITVGPASLTNAQTAHIEFAGDETTVSFLCSLDQADLAACTSPVDLTALTEGPHSFVVKALDVDAAESDPAEHAWTVDLTAPSEPSLSGPPAVTGSTSASLSFADAEPSATFLCSLDGGSFSSCSSPVDLAGLGEGLHVFAVKARDLAGNEGLAATRAWTVDVTAPSVAVTSPTDGAFTNDTTPTLRGTSGAAPGDASAVSVLLRRGSSATGPPDVRLTAPVDRVTGVWSVTPASPLAVDLYTVTAEQGDVAGNVGTSPPTRFTIDVSVPSVSLSTPQNGTVTENRSLTFSGAADAGRLVLNLYDGASAAAGPPVATAAVQMPAGGRWSLSFGAPLPDGVFTAVAELTNAAGTTGSSSAAVVVVDNLPPSFTAMPSDALVEQTAVAGERFSYEASAADGLDPSPTVACSPASGAVFPHGTTAVRCTATDWGGHTVTSGFDVQVVNSVPPAPVHSFVTRARNGSVRLAWQKPIDWDAKRVVLSRARRGTTQWQVVLRTQRVTAFTDTRVANGREYRYRAMSYDLVGNVSAPALSDARPSRFMSPIWRAQLTRPPRLQWSPVRGADYYNVQVWRGPIKVLSRWPGRPSHRMAASWQFGGRLQTLEPGTYFAYAWPGYGSKARARYGRMIGWTKFVVP